MAQMAELKCLFEVADKAASYYDGKVDVAEAIRRSYILAESFTARSGRSLEQGNLILACHHRDGTPAHATCKPHSSK
jgi:hypothetical protein